MQNDRLRDFLKFFKFHLAWFILSAGFFAVILISGIFLSTKYVVDTATEISGQQQPTATPEQLEIAIETKAPTVVETSPTITASPSATPIITSTPKQIINPTSSKSVTTSTKYIVQAGDTLWSIAKKTYNNGHLFSRISQDNNLQNANLIQVGQTLNLPVLNGEQKGTITSSAWSDDKTVYESYVIVSGDSLWKIAESELSDPHRWMEIYQINASVIGSDPDLIYPTVTLKIPSDAAQVQPTSSSPQSFNWTSSLLQ